MRPGVCPTGADLGRKAGQHGEVVAECRRIIGEPVPATCIHARGRRQIGSLRGPIRLHFERSGRSLVSVSSDTRITCFAGLPSEQPTSWLFGIRGARSHGSHFVPLSFSASGGSCWASAPPSRRTRQVYRERNGSSGGTARIQPGRYPRLRTHQPCSGRRPGDFGFFERSSGGEEQALRPQRPVNWREEVDRRRAAGRDCYGRDAQGVDQRGEPRHAAADGVPARTRPRPDHGRSTMRAIPQVGVASRSTCSKKSGRRGTQTGAPRPEAEGSPLGWLECLRAGSGRRRRLPPVGIVPNHFSWTAAASRPCSSAISPGGSRKGASTSMTSYPLSGRTLAAGRGNLLSTGDGSGRRQAIAEGPRCEAVLPSWCRTRVGRAVTMDRRIPAPSIASSTSARSGGTACLADQRYRARAAGRHRSGGRHRGSTLGAVAPHLRGPAPAEPPVSVPIATVARAPRPRPIPRRNPR